VTTTEIITWRSLAEDLDRLGVRGGSALIVHSSLRAVGPVVGGPQVLVHALLDVLGESGTLIVPTHTMGLSDPSTWRHPPVPLKDWPMIRDQMPPYDPILTPTNLGTLPELVRRWPGAYRSSHPLVSFAAVGGLAEQIVGWHQLDHPLGNGSPLAKLYDLDADILLIGVGHESNTALHLGEYRAPGAKGIRTAAPVTGRGWVEIEDIETHEDLFDRVGKNIDADHTQRGLIGVAESKLVPVRPAVDISQQWFTRHRQR
jgi:aminoglycoside 3-N-acetyltransferase